MSTPIDFIQVNGYIDSSYNTSNPTVTLTSNVTAGNTILVSQGTSDNAPTNIPLSDNQGNTYTRIANSTLYDAGGSSKGLSWWKAVANATGSLTVTGNKAGANCGASLIVYEAEHVHPDILDALAVTNFGSNAAPTVTSDAGQFTNDVVLAAVIQSTSSVTGLTVSSPFSLDYSLSSAGSFFQHQTVSHATTSAAAATAAWTESNSLGREWTTSAIVLKGYTTAPTITGVSSATPRKSAILDIIGVNFGSTPGLGDIGGTNQPIYSWSDELVQVIVSEGTNKFGVPLSVTLTTAGSIHTNAYSGITGLLPQAGNNFINVDTPDPVTADRLTASTDMASADQIDWDTVGNKVNVDSTGVPDAYPSVTSFGARLWTSSGGWGAVGIQTISTSDYTPPPDTVVSGGHKPTLIWELPGIHLSGTRVTFRDLRQGEKSALADLTGYTNFTYAVDGTFGGGYALIEGSDDGTNFSTVVDTDDSPLTFDIAAIKLSTDAYQFIRARVVGGDGTTALNVVLTAS